MMRTFDVEYGMDLERDGLFAPLSPLGYSGEQERGPSVAPSSADSCGMGAIRLVALAALLALLTVCHAVGPRINQTTYSLKGGEIAGMHWDIAEFDVTFDQEYFKLELQDCPPVPETFAGCAAAPDPSTTDTCGPCNYAATGADCGKPSRQNRWNNCTCDMTFCTDPDYQGWIEIKDLNTFSFRKEDALTFDVYHFRFFIPEASPLCNQSIFFRCATELGDPDLYIGDPINGPSTVKSQDFSVYWPWLSYRSMGDAVHICPTDDSTSILDPDVASFKWVPGTWWVFVLCNTELTFNLSSATPAQGVSWCDDAKKAPYNHFCLENDNVYYFDGSDPLQSPLNIAGTAVFPLVAQVPPRGSEPCPQFFGVSLADDAVDAILISFTDYFPLPQTTLFENFIVDQDYQRQRIAVSFCSADPALPTNIYINIQNSADTRLRIFSTSDKRRFQLTSWPSMGAIAEQYAYIRDEFYLTCPTAPNGPDGRPNFYPCGTRQSGYQCLAQNFANLWGMPPVQESTPFFPTPNYATLYSPIAGLNSFPPHFVDELVYRPNYFGFNIILTTNYWSGFQRIINQFLDPVHLDSCYVTFHKNTFVNKAGEAIVNEATPLKFKQVAPVCNYADFQAVSKEINELIVEIANTTSSLELGNLQDQLNYQAIREAYVGCLQLANTLLNETATTDQVMSSSCVLPTLAEYTVDPCCRPLVDWNGGCSARPVNITTYTYQPNDLAVNSACASSECTTTYVADLANAKTQGCGDPIPSFEQWFTQHTRWWLTCSDMIFGPKLVGKRCNVDADCVTPYNVNGTSYYCEVTGPFNTVVNPFYGFGYTAGKCVEKYDDLVSQFLRCFLDQDPLLAGIARADANSTSDEQLIANIKANNADEDCVSTFNLGVADWDTKNDITLSAHGTQRHAFANTGGCFNNSLYGANVPILGRIDEPPGGFYEGALTTVRFDVPIICDQSVVAYVFSQGAASVAACNDSLTCNHMGSTCDHLPPANCTDECMSKPGACVICAYPGHCTDPLGLNQTDCGAAIAASQGVCQRADGTHFLTDKATCTNTVTCTHPYWDGTAYRAATSASECSASGYCNDAPFETWWGGACVYPPETYFRRPCQRRYSICRTPVAPLNCTVTPDDAGCAGCVSDDIGCVVYPSSYNQSFCETKKLNAASSATGANPGAFFGVWHAKARTEAMCAAHGCGCYKSGAGQGMVRTFFLSNTPANASYCAQFDTECIPYFKWTGAKWVGGTWRGIPQWQVSAVAPTYNWTTSSPDWGKLAHYVVNLVDRLYAKLATTQAQCRLNRIAPALEAVSCSCSNDPRSSCLRNVTTGKPIGITSPCAGIALDVAIPPHSFSFSETSVTPAGSCLDITVYAVPRLAFGNLSPSQPLSTYFTHLSRAARKDGFEFKNKKDAFVGQVIGDGVNVAFPTGNPATNVTLCLDEGGFYLESVLSTLNMKDYPVFDFAIASKNADKVTPLNISVYVRADGAFCGSVELQAAIYVPIVRAANYLTKNHPTLDAGEQAIFIIAASIYVLVILYASYHMFYIVKYPGMASPWLTPPFWLCALLAISSLIRAVYFYLLGGQVIRSSNIGNMILVEVPTFIWFTATTLVVFLWISVTSTKKQKHVAVIFRRLFLISNGLVWGLLILFIILFVVLKDKKKSRDEVCQGRLGFTIDRTARRVLFIVYQVFLASLALLISISFLFYGTRVYIARSQLKKTAPHKKGGSSRADERNLLLVVICCSLSFAAHAVLLLVLALVDPGIAYLVVILVLVEVGPSMFVLWANPSPKERRVTATSLSRGSRSTTSKTSSATHSTSSHSHAPGPSGDGSGSGTVSNN